MKTRTSPAGSPTNNQQVHRFLRHPGRGGFTLLELLVVLVVVGLIATAIPGFLVRDNDSLDLDRATRKIAEGLRSTQSAAIVENRDQRFDLDVEHRQFLAGSVETPVQLPADIDLRFITARQEQAGMSAGRIRFFPDGSSTGGRIMLELRGHQTVIDVDWLTGQVLIMDDTG